MDLMEAQEKVLEELARGRDFANQLRSLLDLPFGDEVLVVKEDLVLKILDSFGNSLSILKSGEYDEVSQVPRRSYDGRKSEDSGESIRSTSSVQKDRRGCHKRSGRTYSDSWTREHPFHYDDGHAWRKYGQKKILHNSHPRSYYRCTYKFDQGCQASKQIQMVQENPPRFRATYFGHHTCTNPLKQAEIALGTDSINSSNLLSFGSPSDAFKPHGNSFFSSTKQDPGNLGRHNDLDQHQFSSPEYLPSSPGLVPLGSSNVLSDDPQEVVDSIDFGDLDFDF